MPDIADLQPPTSFSPSPDATEPTPSVGLWRIGKDAASSEWVGSWLVRKFDRADYLYDPYFELSADKVKSLGEGLPPEYWDRFSEAKSEGEAQAIRRQLLDVHGARQRLADAGWTGRAAQIGANIIDPAAIALTLGTAGLGGEVAYGGKAARLAMLARAGLAVGGTNAALEGLRATEDPEVGATQVLAAGAGGFGFGAGSVLTRGLGRGARVLGGGLGQAVPSMAVDAISALSDEHRTAQDVLYGGAFSFAMGGILNGLHSASPEESAAATRLRKRIELDDVRAAGGTITPKGEAYFRDVLPEAEAATTARLTDKTEAAIDAVTTPAEAAATPAPPREPSELERIDAEVGKTIAAAEPKARAEAFAREIITSGWYDPGTQKATLREELISRFGVGAGVADRMIDRLAPERPPEPPGRAAQFREPALTFAERAEIEARLAEVPTAPAPAADPAVAPTRFGQGVSPKVIEGVAADTAPVPTERRPGSSPIPASLRPETPGVGLHLPQMLTAEEATARGYDYAELGGQSVSFSDAFALAKELNQATPGRDYSVVETGDGFTVGSRAVALPARKGKAADVAAYKPPADLPSREAPKMPPVSRERIVARAEAIRTAVPAMDRADAIDIAGRQLAKERAEQIVEQLRPPPRDPTSPGPAFSVGAATLAEIESGARATQRGEKLPGDLNLSEATDARSFNPRIASVPTRVGMAGLNGQSESPTVRRVTSMLVEDPMAKADGSPSRQSASEWGRLKFEVDTNNFLRQHTDNFTEWAERNGQPVSRMRPFARSKAFAQFSEEVGRAIRREEGTYSPDPAVNRSANYIREGLDKLWMLQNRYQVPGFDVVTPYHNYLTRIWSLSKLNAATAKYGAQAVENLIATAIQQRTEGIGPERAAIMAKGMLRTIREAKLGTELDRARVLDLPDVEVIRKAIRDAVPGIADEKLNDVLYHVKPTEGEGLPPRVRRRVVLDETAGIDVADSDGQLGRLAVEDLLENNAAKVYARYARDAYGRSAVAEVIRANRTGPDDPLDSVQGLLERVRRQAFEDYGVTNRDAGSKVDAEVARLETAFKSVLGHRLTGDSKLAEGGRMLRAINYLLLGGRFGLNNVADLATAVGEAGFGTTLRSMPSLARIIASAVSGKMKDETIREIEAIWAAGTDTFRGSIGHYLDHDARVHAMGEAADEAIRAGARTMSYANFMSPVEAFNAKVAAILAEQKWLDFARSGKGLGRGRLADMGLTEAEAAAISEQMQTHATTTTGLFGRKIVAANVGQWDPDVAAKYIGAVDRWSRSAVVRNDIGGQARWMTTDIGQTLMQFRAFSVSAHEKTLLRNVRRADLATFNSWLLTSVVGALAYVANEYANSIGRPDAEEYRRKKLATGEIARASFQRASWTAFLPSAVDTAATGLGYDPLFAGGRFSGLSTNLLTGNPSYSTGAAIYDTPRAITSGMHGDKRFTRNDFHTLRRLVPFQNTIGLKNVLDAVELGFPKREK